jgi:nucleoside-diphosphate-sugar epimerase
LVPEHPLNGRRILVIGGTGFVGRHLVRTLAEVASCRIRLLTRGGTVEDLPAPARPFSELVLGDLEKPETMDSICAGVDAILHLAPARPVASRDRVASDLALALRAAEAGVRRLVFVSTVSVVDPVITPPTPFILAKQLAEEALLELDAHTGLETVILRPCLVAGEQQRGGPLLTMFRLCRRGVFPVFGDRLDAQRSIVDVEDVAHALILAATQGKASAIYAVTSGVHHNLAELLEAAGRLVGNQRPHVRLPAAFGRASLAVAGALGMPLSDGLAELLLGDQVIDIEQSRRELGYRPHYRDLRAMLARTYAWYGMSGQL